MDIFIGDIFDCTKQEQYNFFYRLVFMIARVPFPVISCLWQFKTVTLG